jgi:hypothetical protein
LGRSRHFDSGASNLASTTSNARIVSPTSFTIDDAWFLRGSVAPVADQMELSDEIVIRA